MSELDSHVSLLYPSTVFGYGGMFQGNSNSFVKIFMFGYLIWKNFKNNGNLWSILSKLNLRNFILHQKARNLKFLPHNIF
jgi:hypothetical protein